MPIKESTSSKQKPVLEMENIRKTFPGVIALDNVNFSLLPSEVHVLLGENGAGKSTLVKIISGAYQKSSGSLILNGTEIELKNPRHAQQLGISIIYQEFNLIPKLSAAENIFLGREFSISPGVIDQKKVTNKSQEILDDLGVAIDARSVVGDLGIAQKQMVEVAKALSLDAKIIIMDEPTSALTSNEIDELFKTIRKLKARGVSIIYISHRLEELSEIGDRVTVLRDGGYVGTHHISDLSQHDIIRMMVDRELTAQYPKQKTKIGDELLRVEKLHRDGCLHDISFTLNQGEILGVAGLLGSGRTDLARAIFGVNKIDSGNIYINGNRHTVTNPRSAINLEIGYLSEDRKIEGLVLDLSVQSNVSLASLDRISRFGVINKMQEKQSASKYVKDLRIKTPGLHQKVLYLSGGNQQKVVVSKWLSTQAKILIFDEPTRGIDVGSKVEIYQLMNQLKSKGAGIIMISSELPEILGMSDRVMVMRNGGVTGIYDAEKVTQEKILQDAVGAN
jgi:ribose transport system ATP-binding protein